MSKAERTVRERYPRAKCRKLLRCERYSIFSGEEWRLGAGAPIIGTARTRAAAWRDAASKLPPKESDAAK